MMTTGGGLAWWGRGAGSAGRHVMQPACCLVAPRPRLRRRATGGRGPPPPADALQPPSPPPPCALGETLGQEEPRLKPRAVDGGDVDDLAAAGGRGGEGWARAPAVRTPARALSPGSGAARRTSPPARRRRSAHSPGARTRRCRSARWGRRRRRWCPGQARCRVAAPMAARSARPPGAPRRPPTRRRRGRPRRRRCAPWPPGAVARCGRLELRLQPPGAAGSSGLCRARCVRRFRDLWRRPRCAGRGCMANRNTVMTPRGGAATDGRAPARHSPLGSAPASPRLRRARPPPHARAGPPSACPSAHGAT
jgi:hypothetical protein